MNKSCLLLWLIGVGLGYSLYAQDKKAVTKPIVSMEFDRDLGKAFPGDIKALREAIGHGADLDASRILVSMHMRSRDALMTVNVRKEDIHANYDADVKVWTIVAMLYGKSKDQEIKKVLLEEWDKALEDSPFVISQMESLLSQWGSRSFFTEKLWKLLEQSVDVSTVSAICFVMKECGDKQDLDRMLKMRMKMKGTKTKPVDQAINALRCRISPGLGQPAMVGVEFPDFEKVWAAAKKP